MPDRESELVAVQPIVVKKKIIYAGHHGGAWKVAYADFVTAMMAFFIVLWLMGTSEPVKKAVTGYFRDPSGRSGNRYRPGRLRPKPRRRQRRHE
jgi:flagellar motor protein MotB